MKCSTVLYISMVQAWMTYNLRTKIYHICWPRTKLISGFIRNSRWNGYDQEKWIPTSWNADNSLSNVRCDSHLYACPRTWEDRQCPSWMLYSPDVQLPLELCLLVLKSRCHCRQAEIDGRQSADTKSAIKDPENKGWVIRTISWALIHVLLFCSSIFITPLAWILPLTVLLGREKMIRFIPSNSSNLTGGGGSSGTRRMTDDSTWGGGRKSFRETLMTLSTFA